MSLKVNLTGTIIVLNREEAVALEEKFDMLVGLAGWPLTTHCYWEESANRDETVIDSRLEYRRQLYAKVLAKKEELE